MTSFISGFVIFSVLGYMAYTSGQKIEEVATEGPGLVSIFVLRYHLIFFKFIFCIFQVFDVYPAAIATMPYSTFWALIFFMMLLTLGLDSSFGGSEAIITALSDEFPKIKRNREVFVGCLFSLYFVVGLLSCTQGGFYFFQLLDKYAAGYSILIAVLFETVAVSWIYGVDRFSADIKDMIGFSPGKYWTYCWKFAAPVFLIFIIVFGLINYEPLSHGDYVYPSWANGLGWFIAISSMSMIPLMATYKVISITFNQMITIILQ